MCNEARSRKASKSQPDKAQSEQAWTACEHLQRRMAAILGAFSSAN
jgi:hypothetical protein